MVQQRSGVSLAGGVGRAGDAYERHADAVADRVVRGESATELLDQMSTAGGVASSTAAAGGVQHRRRAAVQRTEGPDGGTQPSQGTDQAGQGTSAQGTDTQTQASATTFQGQVDRVEWTGSHAMTAFGGDARVNPVWTPGTATHAAAYTQGSAPALNVHIGLGTAPPSPLIQASVRAKLGGAVVAEGNAAVSGNALDATGLPTQGLPNADRLTRALYSLSWEASMDGQTWSPLGTSGEHRIYWLVGAPQGTLYSLAADKVTEFGANNGDPATAIRIGIHGAIPYDPSDGNIEANPLTMFSGGGHVCADFANLLTALGRAAGLASNPLIYFGGLTAAGKMLWVRESTTRSTLTRVQPGNHDFTYHAIANVGGAIHDAALNRVGIDARATMRGVSLKAVDLSAASVPAGKVGQAYDRVIDRTAQAVTVQQYAFGGLLDGSSFGLVVPLDVPPGTSGVAEIGGAWSITAGALPPGLALQPTTGRLSGTPTAAGTHTFTVQIDLGGGITGAAPITMQVDP